jgi:hypothetical protein
LTETVHCNVCLRLTRMIADGDYWYCACCGRRLWRVDLAAKVGTR